MDMMGLFIAFVVTYLLVFIIVEKFILHRLDQNCRFVKWWKRNICDTIE